MTLLYRIALLGLLTSLMTACETLYIDQPTQPAPVYIPVVYPEPQSQPVPSAVYPSQPVSVPAPIQTPPLPPSGPSKPAVAQPAPVREDNVPKSNVIPVRAPGSISDLPDPS